ncbi:MAG: 4-hydroxy-tetrahydrodipicolinate synthase [Oscillospiraceae bacterium]|nr:4-hydroxy-tetrahydrodipicolinate synthase [Oscillospiraceae bacterium]
MKTPIFTGSGVAIVTPFTNNGVDFDKLGELIEFHIANKTDAIIVCGTTGEASTMLTEEHKSVVKYTVDKVAKRLPVIAGTGSNNTAEAIDLSTYAESVGADGLLIVTPYYNKTTQKGLYLHFEQIANAVNIPIVLYNIPGRTGGLAFSIETLKKLAKLPNINAVKEATGDLAFVAKIAAETDLVLYSGNDDIIVPVMSVGGVGVISVVANILPAQTHDICEKYLNGDVNGSKEMFLAMLDLVNSLFVEVNPIPIKTAMNLLGYNVGPLRMPLCDMDEKNLATLKTAIEKYGLKM